jgi:hypothetical protein
MGKALNMLLKSQKNLTSIFVDTIKVAESKDKLPLIRKPKTPRTKGRLQNRLRLRFLLRLLLNAR